MPYRFIDHTGDTAVEVTASDESEFFQDAARALAAIIIDVDHAPPDGKAEQRLDLDAEDGEALLVDFLNELIFLFDSRRFLPWTLAVEELAVEAPARLRATVRGDTFDPDRHVFLTEVKAATFHDVEIRQTKDGWETTIVFDL